MLGAPWELRQARVGVERRSKEEKSNETRRRRKERGGAKSTANEECGIEVLERTHEAYESPYLCMLSLIQYERSSASAKTDIPLSVGSLRHYDGYPSCWSWKKAETEAVYLSISAHALGGWHWTLAKSRDAHATKPFWFQPRPESHSPDRAILERGKLARFRKSEKLHLRR